MTVEDGGVVAYGRMNRVDAPVLGRPPRGPALPGKLGAARLVDADGLPVPGARGTVACAGEARRISPGSDFQRARDELVGHLRDAQKLLIDTTAAQRNQLDQAIAGNQMTVAESQSLQPKPRVLSWPINSNPFPSDPASVYRVGMTSRCGR